MSITTRAHRADVITRARWGLPIAWVPIRTIYAGEPSHIQPLRHLREFLRVSLEARRTVRGETTRR